METYCNKNFSSRLSKNYLCRFVWDIKNKYQNEVDTMKFDSLYEENKKHISNLRYVFCLF